MPGPLLREMERLFGAGFDNVRIQASPKAAAPGAKALTCGSVIVFAPGLYAPGCPGGNRLLGHELTHVIQQRAGRAVNPFGRGLALLRDRVLEAEADRMGGRFAAHAGGARGVPEVELSGRGAQIAIEQIERARGRMIEDQLRRQYAGPVAPSPSPGHRPGMGRSMPVSVYHGTSVVLDRFPNGPSNWFTWDLDVARAFSNARPGVFLVYKYSVAKRSDRALLILRHRGEFSKPLGRLLEEQAKAVVDGWIEQEPEASLMLSRPDAYLICEAVMGCIARAGDGGGREGDAAWTGWRALVEQIEAETEMRHRFRRGRRGAGNSGAYDRLLAQEIARESPRHRPPPPAERASTGGGSAGRINSPSGSHP